MRKGLFAAALVSLFMLIGAPGAQAQMITQAVNLAPGSHACTSPVIANFRVRAFGQASSPGVTFTLKHSPDGTTFRPINRSQYYTQYWAAAETASWSSQDFPGFFKVCVDSNSTVDYTTVNLTVKTDGDS